LQRAIKYFSESYRLHPPNCRHPDPSMPANGLSGSYIGQYRRTRDIRDIVEAVRIGELAAGLRPTGHPFRAETVETLAHGMHLLASARRDMEMLERAIILLDNTISDADKTNSLYLRANLINQLALSLSLRSKLIGADEDRVTALRLHDEATGDALSPPMIRFECSREWIDNAAELGDDDSLTAAYERCLELLPRIAYLGLDNASRLRLLRKTPTLSSDAAIHALKCSTPERAVELLEEGRSVFWNQALHLRVPSTGLPPPLVEQLQTLSHKLEATPSTMDDRAIADRRKSADDFENVIDSVRKLSGHERFFRTPLFSELRMCAKHGIVVTLVANRMSTEAVIIRDSSATAERLPLHSLTYEDLKGLNVEVGEHTGNNVMRGEVSERLALKKSRPCRDAADHFAPLLARLWKKIVAPITAHLGLNVSTRLCVPLLF
jgi:hypothetical protein